jgi:hypothetical protein
VTDGELATLAAAALAAVRQEYPHRLDQELRSDRDLRPPRELHPSFYGSYDWHSAVHNHWLLVRALARGLTGDVADAAVEVLDDHLGPARTAGEMAFFSGPGGQTAERPYGWAWLLLLHAECDAIGDARHRRWAGALAPLAELLSGRLATYFRDVLAYPVRSGTHRNTAFSLHLMLQAARHRQDGPSAAAAADTARHWYGHDRVLPWTEPPSGDDFLCGPLTEAALMSDVLLPGEFGTWLDRVLPDPAAVAAAAWTPPEVPAAADDPGTVHLEGLLVSRAWCLGAVASRLPPGHPAAPLARAAALAHVERAAKLDPTAGFGRSHWLPTFLLYLDDRASGRRYSANASGGGQAQFRFRSP